MTNHQAASSGITMAASRSDTRPDTASKLFYENVRARFLQQSARYLRTGISGGNAASRSAEAKPAYHKAHGQYQACY